MTAGPLTRADLDQLHCAVPGCTHEDHREMWLHGACHRSAGSRVKYDRERGTLIIACRQCEKFIAEIAVAP
jgi:hypothetical protein